jgi:cytoskeletal protein CcmA (bactofilin family)
MRCRVLVATAVAFVCLLAIAHPAGAQDTGGEPERDRRISVTGGLVVAEGETVDGPAVSANGDARIDGRVNGAVYIGRGDLLIDGRVAGDALVLDGDAVIDGRVDGSVTVLNGKATIRPGANVLGDVASRTAPTAATGTVRGHVEKLDVDSLFAGFVVVILAMLWVAVTLSTAVLGLLFVWLFPRAADAVVLSGRRVWSSFFLGLFLGILAPILGVGIIASVVGIPLGIAVLGTLVVLGPLGYVAGALNFGRLMVHRDGTGGRIGAFFAGFGILRFGALVPGVGFIIGFFFATYGFGAIVITAWRAGRRALGAEELQPTYFDYESLPPGTFSQPPRRRRPPARKSRARKAPAKKARARKAPAKKRATTARKTGPRKSTARKRPARAKAAPRKGTTRKTAKKRTTRTKAAPRKRAATSSNSTKKRRTPAKRGTNTRASANKSRGTKKRTKRRTTKRTTKKRTTKKRTTTKKAPARKTRAKARPSKSRARTARS